MKRWEVSYSHLAIGSGASGTDIFFAEESRTKNSMRCARSKRSWLPRRKDSLRPAGSDWVEGFHALCKRAQIAMLPKPSREDPNENSIYAWTNLWIIETTRKEPPENIYALRVWDDNPTGAGSGGTSAFQGKVCHLGGQVEIMNPLML